MRRILVWVVLGPLLAAAVWLPAPRAFGQQDGAAQRQKAQEFARLWKRLPQTEDPKERIALADRALKLERQLSRWPLDVTRERARAILWWWLGRGYDEFPRGDRADNIERAIAAYGQALQILTLERSANDWASLQTNLGNAYQQRILGDLADNLEKAIGAYQAALTIITRGALPHRRLP